MGIGDARLDDARFATWDAFVARGASGPHDAVDARTAALTPDSTATILYTSGTTGDPKGVELSHRNVLFDCEAGLRIIGLERTNLTVSYLPYAHIAERILSLYIPQHYGDSHMYLVADPSLLLGALGEVHPEEFFGVPAGVGEDPVGSLGAAGDGAGRRQEGRDRGRHGGRHGVRRVAPGRAHHHRRSSRRRYDAVNAAVLGPIKAMLGLDRVIWAGVGVGADAAGGGALLRRARDADLRHLGHDRDLRRRDRVRSRAPSSSAPSAARTPASSSGSPTTASSWPAARS